MPPVDRKRWRGEEDKELPPLFHLSDGSSSKVRPSPIALPTLPYLTLAIFAWLSYNGGDCLAIVAVATSWALMRVPRVPVHEEAGGGFRTWLDIFAPGSPCSEAVKPAGKLMVIGLTSWEQPWRRCVVVRAHRQLCHGQSRRPFDAVGFPLFANREDSSVFPDDGTADCDVRGFPCFSYLSHGAKSLWIRNPFGE